MMLGCRWTVAIGTPRRSCARRAPKAIPDAATTVRASGVPLDVPVDLGHRRQNRAPGHHFESLARVPQVGIGDGRPRVVEGADRQESQSLRLDQLLKERVGENRGPMPSRLREQAPSATTGWTSPALPIVGRMTSRVCDIRETRN